MSRLKKKYENELRELELRLEVLSRANAELSKSNKSLSNRVKVLGSFGGVGGGGWGCKRCLAGVLGGFWGV